MSENKFNLGIPEKFKGYIFYNFGTYAVKNDKNMTLITFGRFSSLDVACAATEMLMEHDWDILEIANNPLQYYLNEYWVFKVMNNKLIFDRKFSSFEKATEYLEINSRCNNYHNDIFAKKKRKPKYSNMPITREDEDINIPNIYSKNGFFIVKYKRNGKEYGVFSSIDEAIVAKNMLIENNWKISNSIEIKFYNSFYWIFKIDGNVLSFINKFESYEDALDCLDLVKSNKYVLKKLNSENSIGDINGSHVNGDKQEDYINESFKVSIKTNSKVKSNVKSNEKVTNQKRYKSTNKKRKVKRPQNHYRIPKVKHKLNREDIIIKNIEDLKKENFKMDVGILKSEFFIIQFQDNALKDYYSISLSNQFEIQFSSNIHELREFDYIMKILSVYNWNLRKINNSSLIHYYNNSYHIIASFNEKLIISSSFDSYGEAEEGIEFLYDYYSSNRIIPKDMQKHGDYYKYIGEHNGETFEIAYQKSFETLMAIISILEYYKWNSLEFTEYDLYYYHGFYWELECFNNYIKLKGRFYSKEDAIKHKLG